MPRNPETKSVVNYQCFCIWSLSIRQPLRIDYCGLGPILITTLSLVLLLGFRHMIHQMKA